MDRPAKRCLFGLVVVLCTCGGQATPTDHRPTAVACGSNDPKVPVACTTNADCNPANGPAPAVCKKTATGMFCTVDQCLTDADCGTSGVCSCQGQTRGYAGSSSGNVCVPSNCRTDANCAASEACSPTVSADCGTFYGIQGYYCHTPADTCTNDTDCTAGGQKGYCAYSTETGHWACGYSFCAG